MTRKKMTLVDELATELMILRAAWILADDDNRKHKPLWVGPSNVKRWSSLIRRAGKAPYRRCASATEGSK